MPELSRFGGMVIYMLFQDTGQHNKPHVHVYMENMRRRSPLTASCWPALCRTSS